METFRNVRIQQVAELFAMVIFMCDLLEALGISV